MMEHSCDCGAVFGSQASMLLHFTETHILTFTVNYGSDAHEIKRSKESEAWRCMFCDFKNMSLLLLRTHALSCGQTGETEVETVGEVEKEKETEKDEASEEAQEVTEPQEITEPQVVRCQNPWCIRKTPFKTNSAYMQHMAQ
ncbi:hypothetical protein HDU99_008389, partial [Rhizoclosmatium hyalinum]